MTRPKTTSILNCLEIQQEIKKKVRTLFVKMVLSITVQ